MANGDAECYLTVPDNENVEEAAGAKTDGVTVVPSSAEFNGNSSYRNYWTGFMDFRAVDKTANDSFEHAGAFIRVNDRTWAAIDQTRIGTFVWTDSNTASLQFTGDNSSNSSLGTTWLEDFSISEHPFSVSILLMTRYIYGVCKSMKGKFIPLELVGNWNGKLKSGRIHLMRVARRN